MLAIVYILVCFLLGYGIIGLVLPKLNTFSDKTYSGKQIKLSSVFIKLPAWYVTGTVGLTWLVYILACCFKNTSDPLLIANLAGITAALAVSVFLIYILFKRKEKPFKGELKKISVPEIIALFLVCVLICVLMFRTLYVKDGELGIGLSVFSDFSTHLSMIRSFSHGSNFPTQYTFFGGIDVKYHFMFQFLCGNLEYLGLRIDLAFNFPSILSLLSAYMMLYALAVKLTGKKSVGILTWLLFTFRSGWALFEYMKSLPKDTILDTLAENAEFIGATENENWGLWNLNVYCNQRHLAFSLTVLIFVIMLMLPCLYSMFIRVSQAYEAGKIAEGSSAGTIKTYITNLGTAVKSFFGLSMFSKEGWMVKDFKTPVFAGLLLGGIGFFNGAVLIGTVIVLFFMAAASDRRVEFVILAGIAAVLSMLQSNSFIEGSLFDTRYGYGFLSANKNLVSSIDYIWKLMGILSVLLIVEFFLVKGVKKYIMVCFSMPIIFAFTILLTPDISVNHKYIMIAIMLLDIFAADLVIRLFSCRGLMVKLATVLITCCLTFTGLYEFEIVLKKNVDERSMKYPLDDELAQWIWTNTDSDDIFLTSNYYLMYGGTGNSIIMSGAKMYYGWDYFSWSAGYDMASRIDLVHGIYSCTDIDELYRLVDSTEITYIVINRNNRESADYVLAEWIFDMCYDCVYSSGEGIDKISVYDVSRKLLKR